WDAILLDAKIFDQSEENEEARLVGLRKAIDHINKTSLRRNIPYFISTGQPDLMDDDTFKEIFGEYYIKGKDDLRLIADIIEAACKSTRFEVKSLYFDAIEQLSLLDENAARYMLDILETMHYPASHLDFNPVLYYNQLRQILEWNFRNANKYAIIPYKCIVNDKVNLNQCCYYLCGKNATATEVHFRYGECRSKNDFDRIVPPYIESMMFLILNLGNLNSHTTILTDKEEEKLRFFLNNSVKNSRYLIFSLALQVCEITIWMSNYINEHREVEKNRAMFRIIDNTEQEKGDIELKKQMTEDKSPQIQDSSVTSVKAPPILSKELENGKYYQGILVEVENHFGTFLNVKCELYQFPLQIKPRQNNLTKDKVVTFKAVQEPNKKDSSKPFWIATDVRLKE
ncbi:MAG: hypothetical protein II670_09920, partial [Alphaproteobacteria bacterium]|nr:hypothetical protein [Alphaproteobacteria bacterium]